MHTQVGIIGAGPAGLLLAQLLHQAGISSVIVESRSRQYIEERIRAGVLEQNTVDLLNHAGVGERMRKEGLPHHGFELMFEEERHRIDLHQLTGGRHITVYGQHEVVKDLVKARIDSGEPLYFDVGNTRIDRIDGSSALVHFDHDGAHHELSCDFLAGCDGFHGISRGAIPDKQGFTFERVYPFAWLGILAEAAPSMEELIYARHTRGFALYSMRSPTITRLYLQCRPDEDLGLWPDERIWEELDTRLTTRDGWHPTHGPVMQKGVTPMRSFVCEKMQSGRLFLAGDAAHIVPPTGAKGMNLAVADIRHLSRALETFYSSGDESWLLHYSQTCLQRVWRAEHFSWWMTSMMHRFDNEDPFQMRLRESELRYVVSSEAGARMLAENYVGLPFTDAH
jgi:p-hydroxybenzoate 3-monooxygenase